MVRTWLVLRLSGAIVAERCSEFSRIRTGLLVLVLDQPRIVRLLLPRLQPAAQLLERLGVSRIGGDVLRLVRILVEVVQLLARSLQVRRQGAFAERLVAALQHALPRRRAV